MVGIWLEYGQNMVRIWLEYGWSMVGIWLEYGRNEVGMRWEYGGNMVGIWSEYSRNEVGIWLEYMVENDLKINIFFNSDSTQNDSEKLGMAKNLSLNFFLFFTRNLVGFLPFCSKFGQIRSDSYHSAQIRSECVGEGKVLPEEATHRTIFPCPHKKWHKVL